MHMTTPPDCQGAGALWQDGWYRFARVLRSPNEDERPADALIDLVVLHSISMPPGRYGGEEVLQLFTNTLDWSAHPYFESIRGTTVSAHFFIRRSGVLWQFVSCDARAWHAGPSRYRGRDNCNDDSIGIALEGLEGETFEDAQYETLAALCAALAQKYPVMYIAGHEHIAPGRKQDPGSGFQWAFLQHALGWNTRCFPAGAMRSSGA